MTEEQYKKLNDYLNQCFLRLQNSDPIFIANLGQFCYTSDEICRKLGGEKIISVQEQNNLTFEDVILLTREIIEKINKKYLEKFDSLIKNGVLEFVYEGNWQDSVYRYNKSKDQGLIDVSRQFNYEDVCVLVHEFMHSTNISGEVTYNADFLTEFISIYFQEYAKRYLIEQKQINHKEISLNSRIISFLHTNRIFNNYCLVLYAYDSLGEITPDTPKEMKEILNYSDTAFEKECLIILEEIEKIEKNSFSCENTYDKVVERFNVNYKYIIGTLLAYYALEYCNFEDIVSLNEKINTDEYADMNIVDLLSLIKIDLNSDFLFKSIECIKNNIHNDKVIK